MRLYDFKCTQCGQITEELVQNETASIECPCGCEAKRIISKVSFALNGADGSFPTAGWKWEREHERAGLKSDRH